MTTTTRTITSKDGTTIAYDKAGTGPALILVPGMFEYRAYESETAFLAAYPLLSQHFTVYHYDRRGRGDSMNTLPFAVDREIEDIEALIDAAGGSAYLFGISSGAALALEAALKLGSKVKALALYEPPYNDDPEARQGWRSYRQRLEATLAEGRNADAIGVVMGLFGVSPEQIAEMHNYPMWSMWEAIAPTTAYDAAALGEEAAVPTERAARLSIPTLIMSGTETYPFMPISAKTLADAIPNAQFRTLEGQTHEVKPEALAPVLVEFFTAN
jgi:pimeloyl-ACP methyl ester carboxylesterase